MLLCGPVFTGGLMMADDSFNSLCHLLLMSWPLRPLPIANAILWWKEPPAIILTIVALSFTVQVVWFASFSTHLHSHPAALVPFLNPACWLRSPHYASFIPALSSCSLSAFSFSLIASSAFPRARRAESSGWGLLCGSSSHICTKCSTVEIAISKIDSSRSLSNNRSSAFSDSSSIYSSFFSRVSQHEEEYRAQSLWLWCWMFPWKNVIPASNVNKKSHAHLWSVGYSWCNIHVNVEYSDDWESHRWWTTPHMFPMHVFQEKWRSSCCPHPKSWGNASDGFFQKIRSVDRASLL